MCGKMSRNDKDSQTNAIRLGDPLPLSVYFGDTCHVDLGLECLYNVYCFLHIIFRRSQSPVQWLE